jgi:hypothetical protein
MLCTMDLQTIDFAMLDKALDDLIVADCFALHARYHTSIKAMSTQLFFCFFKQLVWKIGINNTPQAMAQMKKENEQENHNRITYINKTHRRRFIIYNSVNGYCVKDYTR